MAKKILSILVEEKTTLIVHMDYSTSAPMIYHCISVTTPSGTVEDGMITDAFALGRRLKSVCADHGIRTKDVVFTLASSKIANRVVTIPYVTKAKVQSLIHAKTAEYFPIDVEKYTFAYASKGKENVTENGNTLDYLVFAAPNDLLKSYYSLAEAMKVNIVALDCDGNSVYQLMKRQVQNKVVMSVHVSRLGTLVNIMSNDELLLQRAIPYGIGTLTDTMMADRSFQVKDYNEAYNLLTTHQVILHNFEPVDENADMSTKKRAEVTETLAYLVSNINRIVEYYNTKFKDQPIAEILCTGAGASIVGIHELFNESLDIHTSTPKNFVGIKLSKKISMNRNILKYVSCFGATIDPVRFVTREIIEKEEVRSSAFGTAIVFAASIVLCVALAGISIFPLIGVKDEQNLLQAKEARLKPIEDRYEQLLQFESWYVLYTLVNDFVDMPNNELHSITDEIARKCPSGFKINSITTTNADVVINATSSDKLASVSALKMKLDTIEKIKNVKISSINQTKDAVTKRRQYTYSIMFDFTHVMDNKEG